MYLASFKKLSAVAVASVALSISAMSSASASELFSFTFAGATYNGSGSLVANSNGDGTFTAVSGSGMENTGGTSLTLVFNPNGTATATSPSGAFYFDNQLFPAMGDLLSNGGLLFSSTGGELNLYSNGDGMGSYTYLQQNGISEATMFTLTDNGSDTSNVPEPASIALLGIGLLGVTALRKKSAK